MRYKEIEDILDEFDFSRVQQVMKALNWKYYNTEGDHVSLGELRRTARYLLEWVYDKDDSGFEMSATGGFEATRTMCPGDPKKYLTLKFVVEEYSNAD